MNEEDFRNKLEEYRAERIRTEILYTDVKDANGGDFIDYHIQKIKNNHNGEWDEKEALARLTAITTGTPLDQS